MNVQFPNREADSAVIDGPSRASVLACPASDNGGLHARRTRWSAVDRWRPFAVKARAKEESFILNDYLTFAGQPWRSFTA